MNITNRSLHRDFAYFYVGLIIAFSFSGIILNHRNDWYPMDYIYENKDVTLELPENTELITKDFLVDATKGLNLKYDGHRIRGNKLRIYYKTNTILDVDLKSGSGSLEFKRKVPILGHFMFLHKSTNNFWIWYSDIFGAAMLLIAITGILIPAGKNGFSKRGWKLAILGMIFPIIFLVLFS